VREVTRVLICGGRDLHSADVVNYLNRFARCDITDRLGHRAWPVTAVMHGGAKGADEGAGQWAESEGIKPIVFRANWRKHGKAAGPMRNAVMLNQGKPDVVIAFPGGRGTKNMTELAWSACVPVIEVQLCAPERVETKERAK
jgi:predicted Rossmann-fold nucleotide-binding protein